MWRARILSGEMAGQEVEVRRFPFLVGRGEGVDLRVEAPGVWGRHVRLEVDGEGLWIAAEEGGATVRLNGRSIRKARVRPGDVAELGAFRARFELSPPCLRNLRLSEAAVWTATALVVVCEVVLFFGLPR